MKFIKRISKNKFGQKFLGFLVFIVTNFTYKSISWKELKKPNSYHYKKKNLLFFALGIIDFIVDHIYYQQKN